MNKQGGFAMSGLAILGICLVAIGLFNYLATAVRQLVLV